MNLAIWKRLIPAVGLAALLSLAILWLAGAALPPAHADPGSLFVKPTGSGTACTQAAPCSLATALGQAVDGDIVYLAAGRYTSSGSGAVVTVTRSISLFCGWDGSTALPVVRNPAAHVSVIDGEGQRRGVYIRNAGRVTVDGCTVVGGNATAGPWSGFGSGIYSRNASPLLAHNIVSGCVGISSGSQDGYGGGIYVGNAGPGTALVANHVEGNSASTVGNGFGGGIAIISAPAIVVLDNTVIRNTASLTGGLGEGGGLWVDESNGARLEHNVIEGNVAQAGAADRSGSVGGGLYLRLSSGVTVTRNTVRNNIASVPANGQGGGIALDESRGTLMQGNLLQGNVACASPAEFAGRGGALGTYASRGTTLDANLVVDNVASYSDWGYGGGFYFARSCSFTMTNNIVAGNHASSEGGGIAFETGVGQEVTGTLLHNTFVNNNLGVGAGQYALHVNEPRITLALTNNLFSGHSYAVFGHTDSTVTCNRNLFYANSLGDIGGANVVNIAPISGQNPLLTSNHHLQAGSPAIDAGLHAGVATDVDGDARPFGAAPDIGADERMPAWLLYLTVVGK